jgi:thymidylate synthase (FAD)
MDKIEVKVLQEASTNPAGMMLFLAKLTQRGHKIHNMSDLMNLYNTSLCAKQDDRISSEALASMVALPHGTIKRFAPITIAIVGASRRFLAQARTNQVGIDYVSASLQYSDYSDQNDFVVPYPIMVADEEAYKRHGGQDPMPSDIYLMACKSAMQVYSEIAKDTDNDTAGYAAPQGLRNILIMQANHQSWDYFIRLRTCNRNTLETQYVALRIWEELLKTADGDEMFHYAGPDCCYGACREGKMSCGTSMSFAVGFSRTTDISVPTAILHQRFPILYKE